MGLRGIVWVIFGVFVATIAPPIDPVWLELEVNAKVPTGEIPDALG